MSYRRLHHRTTAWPALLASLVFVCWPTLVRGSCCCDAKVVAPEAAIETTVSGCQGSHSQESTSCCSNADSITASPTEAFSSSCCKTAHSAAAGTCDSSDDCRCGVRCCRSLLVIANSRTTDSDQNRGSAAIVAEATVEFPVGIRVVSSLRSESPDRFLLAQDHCALVCRWLK